MKQKSITRRSEPDPQLFRSGTPYQEFDFEKSKWSDGDFIDDDKKMKKWNLEIGDFWENMDGVFPVFPYQPVNGYENLKLGLKKACFLYTHPCRN